MGQSVFFKFFYKFNEVQIKGFVNFVKDVRNNIVINGLNIIV